MLYRDSLSHVEYPAGVDPKRLRPEFRYNMKITEYKNSTQVKIYNKPISRKNLDPKKKKKKPYIPNPNIFDFPDLRYEHPFITEDEKKEIEKLQRPPKDKERSLKESKKRTINKIYSIARSNDWEYFFTLTLDPKKIDRTNYDVIEPLFESSSNLIIICSIYLFRIQC